MPSRFRKGEGQSGWNYNSHGHPTAGVETMARIERHAAQIGDPLDVACGQRPGVIGDKPKARLERTRGSDEAIVSVDPAGQYNLLASQGPLDAEDVGTDPPARLSAGEPGQGEAYVIGQGINRRWESDGRRPGRSDPVWSRTGENPP